MFKKKVKIALVGVVALSVSACAGMQSQTVLKGDRVKGEIVRSAGGAFGDDVTTGVIDFADHTGRWKSEDFIVTSTSLAKMLSTALVPGVAVAAIQKKIAEYQVDNQCNEACGDVINVLSSSQSSTLTQVQVQAIAEILNGGHH